MKRSGYLQQRDGRTQALLDVMQRTMKQYMLDTLLITMHEDFGWGYGDDIRQSEAIRCIREALEINPYIKAVHQISVRFEGSTLHLSFKAKTIYGEVILNDGKIAL